MDRNVNDSFKFNQETEFTPIFGLIEDRLNKIEVQNTSASSIEGNHHPALLAVLADELSVAPEEIHDFELYSYSHVCARVLILNLTSATSTIPNPLFWVVLVMNSFLAHA